MIKIKSKQFYPFLKIEIETEQLPDNNMPVLFIWEDQKVSQNVKIDQIELSSNVTYFSSIEKDIKEFETSINFYIVCKKTLKVLFTETFYNLSFIHGNNILYISQNSYTGYGYAARNYIYQLVKNNFNVRWEFIGDSNDYAFSREEEYVIRNCCYNTLDTIDSVIVHHTPEIFPNIMNKYPYSFVYGLTTWEADSLPSDWSKHCQAPNALIVPSHFNKHTFERSIHSNSNIFVWNHTIFPFRSFKSNVYESLISKLISITPLTDTIPNILKNKTVYYNIGEFTPRKNIEQVIHCFCKKFKKQDNVCLLIKTNVQYNDESGLFIKYKLKTILDNYDIDNLPDIVFCFDKNLSDSEIQVIHELGDVYFTLNLGEGFGLVTYTAKQIGNKVICGKYGAEKEFLDPNIDILLDYTMQTNDHMKIQSKFYKNLKTPVYDNEHVIDKLQIFDKTIKPKFNI